YEALSVSNQRRSSGNASGCAARYSIRISSVTATVPGAERVARVTGSLTLLQPTTDLALVQQVRVGKPLFEVALFPRNAHQHDDRQRRQQRDQHDDAVYPGRDPALEQREREIDGVAAVAV